LSKNNLNYYLNTIASPILPSEYGWFPRQFHSAWNGSCSFVVKLALLIFVLLPLHLKALCVIFIIRTVPNFYVFHTGVMIIWATG
jgi:hypothetical protein